MFGLVQLSVTFRCKLYVYSATVCLGGLAMPLWRRSHLSEGKCFLIPLLKKLFCFFDVTRCKSRDFRLEDKLVEAEELQIL